MKNADTTKSLPEYVWIRVSNDKYELPEAVADTKYELAKLLGFNEATVYAAIKHDEQAGRKSRYMRVYIGDLEDE